MNLPSLSTEVSQPESTEPLFWELDKDLFQRMEETVAAQGLSVLHFMYAVMACYFFRTLHFSRTNSAEEIVIGIPVHNRKNIRQKRTVGMFSSVIPVGVTLAPHDTFLDIMNKAAAELRRCYKRQRMPIADINRHIQVQQKTGHAQLFDIMLSYEWVEVNAGIPNAALSYTQIQRGTPFPLLVALYQYAFTDSEDIHKPATLEFNFSPDHLSRADIEALKSRLLLLMEAAITAPDTQIRHLPILPPAEHQQLLVNFNATQADFPPPALIHPQIEAQATRCPEAPPSHSAKRLSATVN
nr:condensation domain-containing protein [Xenorhabdus szentirmaii]